MGNNNAIQFLRTQEITGDNKDVPLSPGQPIYNDQKNYLTIGKFNGEGKISDPPIVCREIVGYFDDNDREITGGTDREYSVSPDKDNNAIVVSPGLMVRDSDGNLKEVATKDDLNNKDKILMYDVDKSEETGTLVAFPYMFRVTTNIEDTGLEGYITFVVDASGGQTGSNDTRLRYTLDPTGRYYKVVGIFIGAEPIVTINDILETYGEDNIPVTVIGAEAFKGVSTLQEITIPSSISTVESDAFENCNLTKVKCNGTLKEWCEINFLNEAANPLNNNSVLNVIGEGGVEEDVEEKLEFSDDIEIIGDYNLCNYKLTEVTIPSSIKSIGDSAFKNCNINKVYYKGSLKDWCGINFGNWLIFSNDSNNYNYLYVNDDSLVTKVNITGEIPDYAFANCKSITSVDFTNTTSIGSQAFRNTDITSVTIPDTVENDWGAFDYCQNLEIVNYTGNDTNITIDGFAYCPKLTSVTINNVKCIEDNAFISSGLTSITIPYGVTQIGRQAFRDCAQLTKVIIPTSVTYIGSMAFAYCDSLTTVEYSGTKTQWKNNIEKNNANAGIFGGCDKLTKITCRGGEVTL